MAKQCYAYTAILRSLGMVGGRGSANLEILWTGSGKICRYGAHEWDECGGWTRRGSERNLRGFERWNWNEGNYEALEKIEKFEVISKFKGFFSFLYMFENLRLWRLENGRREVYEFDDLEGFEKFKRELKNCKKKETWKIKIWKFHDSFSKI